MCWRAEKACIEEERELPDRMDDTGEGQAGTGEAGPACCTIPPATNMLG